MGGVIVDTTQSYHPDSTPYGDVKSGGQGLEGPRRPVDDTIDTRTIVIRRPTSG